MSLRILIAHEAIDSAGGVETYLAALLPALMARGHEVVVVYHHRSRGGAADFAPEGVEAIGVEDRGLAGALDRIRGWHPDVCFSHNMRPLELDRALAAEWPVVKMMHGYFGTCISGLKMHAFPSLQRCERAFGRACLACYFPRRCGPMRLSALSGGYRWASEQHELLSRYAAVIVASGHMAEEYRREAVDVPVHVVPLFSTIAADGNHLDGDTVLFAGRMTTLKGPAVLVEAVARAGRSLGRPVPLLAMGSGPQLEECRGLARSLGVAAEFTGWLGGDARAAVFRRSAILAMPSQWPEPFGLVGLEAGSFGVPAVAFDTGGIGEWLKPGVNGRLVDPASGSVGLAAALADLLGDRDALRAAGEGAKAMALRMSIDAHVNRLERVLQAACERRPE